MAQTTVTVSIMGDDTDENPEREVTFPAEYCVCPKCEGHGTILNPSIGEHAFSAEEFYETFDEEGQREYFRRGGIYDVRCPECNGRNVVPQIAVSKLTESQMQDYLVWSEERRDRAQFEREWAAEIRRERAMCGDW